MDSRAPAGTRQLTAPAPQREVRRRPEAARREVPPVPVAEDADFTMPVLWTELRVKVYEQLPSGGLDLGFTYTVIPMAITGASDTTAPGLGFSGTF